MVAWGRSHCSASYPIAIIIKQIGLTLLPEYHPFVHDEVEDAGEDEGYEVAKDDIESGKMSDENEGDHLDEKGCYAGNIIGKEAPPKSSRRALTHPVLPHKEIGKGVVGEHGTLKRYGGCNEKPHKFRFGKEHLRQKPHHTAIHRRSAKGGEHKLEVSDQLFHFLQHCLSADMRSGRYV